MDIPEIDQRQVAWCRVNNQLVFLDVAHDRYFCLPEKRNAELIAGLEQAQSVDWCQPVTLPRPDQWVEPLRSSPDMEDGSFRLGEVARSLWMQRRVEKRLVATSLFDVLHATHASLAKRANHSKRMNQAARACVRGFEHARLIRTAADRCLPRSIALALNLAARDCPSQLVIGVKFAPFAAHCWVQHRADVLSDSVEEVRRYRPILIL